MPAKPLKIAEKLFPKSAMLSINDYHCGEKYGEQIRDMLSKGCKIDMIGFQRHLWKIDQMKKIAGGEDVPNWSIKWQREILDRLDSFGLPIHYKRSDCASNRANSRRIQGASGDFAQLLQAMVLL